MLPMFEILIEDRQDAEFLLNEWRQRFQETEDYAFKELAENMERYIALYFDGADED